MPQDEQDDGLFTTGVIEFEPYTGYVGLPGITIPEPISGFTFDGRVETSRARPGAISEGYRLTVSDEGARWGGPQTLMFVPDLNRVSRLAAAVFTCCGKPDETVKVGFGFHAFHNALARRIDPTLDSGAVRELACIVTGRENRGVEIVFETANGDPIPIALIQGRLPEHAMHAIATGLRDLAAWRVERVEQLRLGQPARSATEGVVRQPVEQGRDAAEQLRHRR
jgi:hypothetical protein